jgi:hypothetical protein
MVTESKPVIKLYSTKDTMIIQFMKTETPNLDLTDPKFHSNSTNKKI